MECATLFAMMVLGGGSGEAPVERLGAELLGLSLLIVSLLRVDWDGLYRQDRWAAWLGLALLGLFVLQLMPLPATLWSALPGRALMVEGDRLMFGILPLRPLSLDPDQTVAAAVFLVPALAMWLRARTDGAFALRWMLTYLAFMTVSCVLAVAQTSAAPGDLHLYNNSHSTLSTGLFANRNHQAIAMDCAVALAAGLQRAWMAQAAVTRHNLPAWRRWLFAAVAVMGAIGVLLTGSRTGTGLLPLVLLGGGAMVYADRLGVARLGVMAALLVGVVLVGVLATQWQPGGRLGMVFQRSYLADDSRYDFWPTVAQMVGLYAPWGAGLGTFRRVFEISEPDSLLSPLWLNHAHNDWMEFMLDTGLPGGLLVVAFLAWVVTRFWQARRAGLAAAPMAWSGALVVLLLLAHSVFDYPLRTVTMSCCFAVALALLSPRSPHTGDRP